MNGRNTSRRGSALFTTIIVVMIAAYLLMHAASGTVATHQLHRVDRAQQSARLAAEAVAAMREVDLVDIAASNDLERLLTTPVQGQPWQGLSFFGGCAVRWRIEPVLVVGSDNDLFTVNPHVNVNSANPADGDKDADGDQDSFVQNHDIYNFRIATEAHYLADPEAFDASTLGATADTGASNRLAMVQASRVVQLKLNSLFKYALFYAAEGPDGDIEMHNGPAMDIDGAVHSNGAVYFGGDKQNPGSGNYHPGDNGAVDVGTSGNKKTVVGVDGIYRTQKVALYEAFKDGIVGSLNPYLLPLPGDSDPVTGTTMSGNNDVNGQSGTNTYQVNDQSMQPGVNDTRTPAGMASTWGPYVRDGVTRGATVVKTLANIPELGGRPFEHQRRVAPGTGLYYRYPGHPTVPDLTLTILPGAVPAPYYADPDGADADPDNDFEFVTLSQVAGGSYPDAKLVSECAEQLFYVSADPSGPSDVQYRSQIENDATYAPYTDINDILANFASVWPVDAGGLPVWRQRDASGAPLYWMAELSDVTDPAPSHGKSIWRAADPTGDIDPELDGDGSGDEEDGFANNESLGHYLDVALHGGDSLNPGFGIVIRERPQQLAAVWSGAIPDPSDYPGGGGGGGGGGAGHFEQSGSEVVLEAENPTGLLDQGGHSWVEATPFGAVSGSTMQAQPNSGTNNNSGYDTSSPRLDWDVEFTSGGTYYLWVLGAGASGSDDSCHLGINGTTPSSCDRISLDNGGNLSWTNGSMDGGPITFSVPSAGRHTVNLWMREDGAVVDKILLTTNSGYSPSGAGPAESAFVPAAQPYSGAPVNGAPIPIAASGATTVLVEHYDEGADGSAHRDVSASDHYSPDLRVADRVDLMEWPSAGQYILGNIETGDWLGYTIDVEQAGTFDIEVYFYCSSGGGQFHLEFGGVDLTGTQSFATSGWQTITIDDIDIPPGQQIMKLVFESVGTPTSTWVEHVKLTMDTPAFTYGQAMAQYLSSQYIVYFGYSDVAEQRVYHDITGPFFNFGADIAASEADLVAYESWVRNRRETGWMGYTFDIDGAHSIPLDNYHCNWLTLNADHLLDFLQQTKWEDVVPPAAAPSPSEMLNDHFNGVIYAHRTRRSDGYHPVDSPRRRIGNLDDWTDAEYVPPAHGYDFSSSSARDQMAQIRSGDGPDCTFHSGLRIARASAIDWGKDYVSASYSRKRGMTVITANQAFLWGNFNVTSYPDSDGVMQLPPCAIFCDHLSVLSKDWSDAAESDFSNTRQKADDTTYNLSVVTNNIPTYFSNGGTVVRPSGGPHNLVRFLEDWGGRWYHIKGSVVVMGACRYSRADAGWSSKSYTSNVAYYNPPKRDIQFNTDLFSRDGQPPFTPFGVQVVRTVQTIHSR